MAMAQHHVHLTSSPIPSKRLPCIQSSTRAHGRGLQLHTQQCSYATTARPSGTRHKAAESHIACAFSRDAAAEATMLPRWKGPAVDWSRYHLQVLFVDHSDQLRAKLAAAFFEQVAEWNGYSRCLLPSTAGVQVVRTRGRWDWSLQAGLMARAHVLGLPPKVFARSPEAFELRDLDAFDVVVAVDSATRQEMLSRVDSSYLRYYEDKVRVLSEFGQQQPLSDTDVFTMGGLALMPRGMSLQLQQDLQGLRAVLDMPRPSMTDASEAAAACWDTCIRTSMLGAAGLVRYLINSYPPDLPEYDPL